MTVPRSSLVAMAMSAGVVVWVLLRPTPEAPPATGVSPVTDAAAVRARHDEIEQRLQRVEATLAATPTPREVAPVPATATAPASEANAALEQRLAELERLVRQMRSEQLAIGPMPTDLGGVVRALADKNLHGHGIAPELRQRRMDLRRRLLELAPTDPQAAQVLMDLADDYLLAAGPKRAIALLDEWGTRIGVEPRRLAGAYANYHFQAHDHDRAREIYDSLARDTAATEAERASARFWHAYSFYQQRRYVEAASGFQALIDQYGDDPPVAVRDTVGGARNYLQKCREAK